MKVNFQQIVFAREYRGYTQTQLSKEIKGLSQSNLSKFEKGMLSLSDDVIDRIIKVLNFPSSFFEEKILNNIENAHYRKKTTLSKKVRSMLEHENKIIGYIIDHYADSIEFPEFNFKEIDIEDDYTPVTIAQFTRRYCQLGNDPIKDIFTLLEKYGVIVVERDVDLDEFDAVSFITDKAYRVIVINKNMSNDRKRFTLAHELGHIIMHLSTSFTFPSYRDDRTKENEANAFASEFLMPESVIKPYLAKFKMSSLAELKYYWLTSFASIVRRAKDLECITPERYKFFNIELSRKGYKKDEPINVYIDTPQLFDQAYKLHQKELGYSNNELAQAFNLPIDIIEEFCEVQPSIIRLKVNYQNS